MLRKKAACLVIALLMMPICFSAHARQQISDRWELDQTVVRVDADVVLNPDETGAVIQAEVKTFENAALPAELLERGKFSPDSSLTFMDREVGTTAQHLTGIFLSSVDASCWEISQAELPGFRRADAVQKADEAMNALGIGGVRPYYVGTCGEPEIKREIDLLAPMASEPVVADLIGRYRDMLDVHRGLYAVCYPVQYEGVRLMPWQIHANDDSTMTGGSVKVCLTRDRVAYICAENVPRAGGEVLDRGTVIPFEKAVERFKEHMNDILHDEGTTYDVFKIAYEYIPENIVGPTYQSRMTLYPAWCFYVKVNAKEYTTHRVYAFHALTGEIIDGGLPGASL